MCVFYPYWHAVVTLVWNANNSFACGRSISSFYCIEDGFLVLELVGDGIRVRDCSEVRDVENGAGDEKQGG